MRDIGCSENPDRQSRRDRLPRDPHRARGWASRTVAVYSEADADALHVAMADEAVRSARRRRARAISVSTRIIEAARRQRRRGGPSRATASCRENADFAEACAARRASSSSGRRPRRSARWASKAAAKALMEAAGVPVVPGYHGADQDDRAAARRGRADRLSGADQGLRRRRRQGHARRRATRRSSRDALDGARREAARRVRRRHACCSSATSTRPRHVEVQVFGDRTATSSICSSATARSSAGTRRSIEEAPAPGLDRRARARDGRGGGRGGARGRLRQRRHGRVHRRRRRRAFYFMEMNTRLQVEHPVTEAVTGLDLVRVAAARRRRRERCRCARRRSRCRGHAIEVRLYAEDPARGFLPATGTLRRAALAAGRRRAGRYRRARQATR